MKDKDIYDLPVADIAADDCVLFMWATYPKLQEALNAIKAWALCAWEIAGKEAQE